MEEASVASSSGIVLDVLTKDNYDNWSALLENYLVSKKLWWGVVADYSSETDRNEDEIEWQRRNAEALHAIQLSCGSDILGQIRKFKDAKQAWNHLKVSYGEDSEAAPDIELGIVDYSVGENARADELYQAVKENMWDIARACINEEPDVIFSTTTSSSATVLHVAVSAGHEEIVDKLVKKGKERLLNMEDSRGYTALALAASFTGNTKIAECMVKKSRDLLTLKTKGEQIPVVLASAKGHKDMTRYLYKQTPLSVMQDYGVLLLRQCIDGEIFDVALRILQHDQALLTDESNHDPRLLYALADMPWVFLSGYQYGLWQRYIYKILRVEYEDKYGIGIKLHADQDEGTYVGQLLRPVLMLIQNSILLKFSGIKNLYEQKMTHYLLDEILKCLQKIISRPHGAKQLHEASAYCAMLRAAKNGIIEFINAMRMANPNLLWAIDKNKRSVFSHAILHRRENVFELINEDQIMKERIELITSREDAFGNNMLHLAAELGPSSDLRHRSGAALQMQREMLWFKKVEKIVHPKCKEAKNADGKKPREVFSKRHEKLVKAGEKWAKDTATSFTIVCTLIITIMFAAAFTIPGGYNQGNGFPIFLKRKLFTSFIIADAISLAAASTSVLIFIGILTSRYVENDFLTSLPIKLLCGLLSLFFSVTSMMVAFCSALAMMLKGYRSVVIAAILLATIPVLVFVPTQFFLFVEIVESTAMDKIEWVWNCCLLCFRVFAWGPKFLVTKFLSGYNKIKSWVGWRRSNLFRQRDLPSS